MISLNIESNGQCLYMAKEMINAMASTNGASHFLKKTYSVIVIVD